MLKLENSKLPFLRIDKVRDIQTSYMITVELVS